MNHHPPVITMFIVCWNHSQIRVRLLYDIVLTHMSGETIQSIHKSYGKWPSIVHLPTLPSFYLVIFSLKNHPKKPPAVHCSRDNFRGPARCLCSAAGRSRGLQRPVRTASGQLVGAGARARGGRRWCQWHQWVLWCQGFWLNSYRIIPYLYIYICMIYIYICVYIYLYFGGYKLKFIHMISHSICLWISVFQVHQWMSVFFWPSLTYHKNPASWGSSFWYPTG